MPWKGSSRGRVFGLRSEGSSSTGGEPEQSSSGGMWWWGRTMCTCRIDSQSAGLIREQRQGDGKSTGSCQEGGPSYSRSNRELKGWLEVDEWHNLIYIFLRCSLVKESLSRLFKVRQVGGGRREEAKCSLGILAFLHSNSMPVPGSLSLDHKHCQIDCKDRTQTVVKKGKLGPGMVS